jgi:hypothetical protein
MTWWKPLDHVLNPRRLTYALIAGGVLWFAWMISILFGPGNMDLAGQVVGTDYLQFYSAGVTLRQDQSANLYDKSVIMRFSHHLFSLGSTYLLHSCRIPGVF